MEKFLNFSFKFGKWFISLFLVLLVVTGIFLSYSAISNSLEINNYKMDYKFPKTDNSQLNVNNDTNKSYKEKIINAFGENKPTNKFVENVEEAVNTKVKEEDINDFINNLPQYYSDVKDYLSDTLKKENNLTDAQIQNDYKTFRNSWDDIILEKYTTRYTEQNDARTAYKTTHEMARNIALLSLLVTLFLFVISLIIPLLIKIEENTRK